MNELTANEINIVSGGYAPEFIAYIAKQKAIICMDCIHEHVHDYMPVTYDEQVVAVAACIADECQNKCHTWKIASIIGAIVYAVFKG